MSKCYVARIFAGAALFLFLFSCQSAPKSSAPDEAAVQSRSEAENQDWKNRAEEKERDAKVEQDRALGVKANVAMKPDYDAALGRYSQGAQAAAEGDYQAAYENYSQAERMFAAVYQSTVEKRDSTMALMQEAAKKMQASGELALAVQAELSGGGR